MTGIHQGQHLTTIQEGCCNVFQWTQANGRGQSSAIVGDQLHILGQGGPGGPKEMVTVFMAPDDVKYTHFDSEQTQWMSGRFGHRAAAAA